MMRNFFNNRLKKQRLLKKTNTLKDKYITFISENWGILDQSDPLKELVDKGYSVDCSFKVKQAECFESFHLASCLDNKLNSECNGNEYMLPFDNYIHLRFGSLCVCPKYRHKGICSYTMLKIIVSVIEKYPYKNFIFDLVNTSHEISNPYNLYSSILDEQRGKFQYRIFEIKTRDSDISKLQKQLKLKYNKLNAYFGDNDQA